MVGPSLRLCDGGTVVEFIGTAWASFSASHVVEGDPRCGRLHGHRWRVGVTIQAGQDPKTGQLVGLALLADAVEQLCAEIDREDVNAMFPASHPTPAGVGLAFKERLALAFVNIVEVSVAMDDVMVTIRG
jgi:6-pyruvoyl-tetrahydropterin synthase